ncbi:aldehyde dehydrogenase [Neobacillus sp. NPDC097160]|uniref:aldehyde dehydrogenase n=1 Tax=Neobacillus sp. NPDC097160 TaxID=3364298 RepID=UPI003813F53B
MNSIKEGIKVYQLYINGEFQDSTSSKFKAVTNPATGEVISQIPEATITEVKLAIESADKAQKSWSRLPAIERAKYLKEIANKIRENEEQLARTITEEQGKLLSLARVEVNFTADYIDYMAEWARRYDGEVVQSDRPNEHIFVFKKPIGVVSGILPWNFPFFLIARKMAPALVTGNTVVIKPSTETPNNAFEFAKLVSETNLPKGVFNLVSGSGSVVGNELSSNSKIGMVSFTGGVDTGTRIMKAAADNIIKVSLELGGKAPAIVMDDADLELAVTSIKQSRIINNGQVCNCAERVYVHEKVADKFINMLSEAMKNTKSGNPIEESTEIGPLINEASVQHIEKLLDDAKKGGATIITGGKREDSKTELYFQPTVVTNVTQDMDIVQQEIFGPVLPVLTFKDLDEAILLANDSEFGLTSSIYTQNLDVAMKACKELQFGETYINRENFEAIQGFHAGWRKSGIGGADGKHGLEEYLQTHVVYLQYNQDKK